MKERILVGLDDSEESWNAFNYAITEAKEKELDRITVLHSKEGGRPEEYREGEEILEEAEKQGEAKGVKVETELLMRGYDPDVDIVKFAEEKRYDHIIIGHRGRSGIKSILGSVTEGVVKNASTAVTVVRSSPYIERSGSKIRARKIEELLDEHVGVKKSVVLDATDENLEEKIIAFFEPTEGYEPTEEMILGFMEEFVEEGKIERFALPDEVKLLEKLPRNKAGTVNLNALKDKYL